MSERTSASNLPAVVGGRSGQVEVYRPGEDEFKREPPIEVVIDADQLKERIIDYLGAVLARCWVEKGLLEAIEADPHRTLRHLGILLPSEIDIKVERKNAGRPRLLIYEWNQERSYKRRICYLQLVMMAGK